ncbi:MAG: acyltransferase family protein [Syntrophobacteraceae bacterium]
MAKHIGVPPQSGRYASIDGLRGYAAFFVFLHHSAIWYFFLHNGVWSVPPSNLYTQFGQGSVVFFFMITSFLFSSKLINSRLKPIDWVQLYTSRLLRLVPLYIFSVSILFGIVIVLSNYELHSSLLTVTREIIQWISFTIIGTPNINSVFNTGIIIAKVYWSLPYEIFFYLALPFLCILISSRPSPLCLTISIFTLLIEILVWHFPNHILILPFVCGIGTAFIVRIKFICDNIRGVIGSIILICSILADIAFFHNAYNMGAIVLLAIAFSIIASGNTLFGIFSNKLSRVLGEISYSTYLLHGITLFITFKFIVGFRRAATFSPLEHWLTILCCTTFLIPFCSLTFYFIEAPAMRAVPSVAKLAKRLLTRQASLGKTVLTPKFDTVSQVPPGDL